jgi:hypothetical protein
LTSRRSDREGPADIFNDEGEVNWPLGLRILPPVAEIEPLRRDIETYLQVAMEQEDSGKDNGNMVNEAERAITRLQRLLVRRADRLPTSGRTVTEAKRFLRRLKSFAQSLGEPDEDEE